MRSLLLIAALTPQSAYRVPVSRSRAGRIVAVDPNQVAPAADTKPEGVHGSELSAFECNDVPAVISTSGRVDVIVAVVRSVKITSSFSRPEWR